MAESSESLESVLNPACVLCVSHLISFICTLHDFGLILKPWKVTVRDWQEQSWGLRLTVLELTAHEVIDSSSNYPLSSRTLHLESTCLLCAISGRIMAIGFL